MSQPPTGPAPRTARLPRTQATLADASPGWWEAWRRVWPWVLLAVGALVASGGGAIALLSSAARQDAQQLLARHQAQEVETLARLLASKMDLVHKELRLLAAELPLSAFDQPGLLQGLRQRAGAGLGGFDHLLLLDARGDLRWHQRSGQTQSAADLTSADRLVVIRAQAQPGKPQVFSPPWDDSHGAPLRVYFTVPLRHPGGGLAGLLVGGLPLHAPSLLPPTIVPPAVPGSRLLVWTREGTILAHSDPARTLGHVRDEPGLSLVQARWLQDTLEWQERVETIFHADHVLAQAAMPLPQWTVTRIQQVASLRGVPLHTEMPEAQSLAWAGVVLGVLALLLGSAWLAQPQVRMQSLLRRIRERPAQLLQSWPEWPGEAGAHVEALRLLSEQCLQSRDAWHQADDTLRTLLQHAAEGIFITRAGLIDAVGRRACRMLGYEEHELQGQSTRKLFAQEEDWVRAGAWLRAELAAHGQCEGAMTLSRKDGVALPVRLRGHLLHPNAPFGPKLWLMEDTTAAREAQAQQAWEATHDGLTQLFNRDAFVQRLQRLLDQRSSAIQEAAPSDIPVGVLLYLDVDHFSQVNESAGHVVGDDVLRRVARLLETEVNHLGWAAHLGGDEFGVVLPDCPAKRGLAVAEQLRAVVESWQPAYPARGAFQLTVSIGLWVLEVPPGTVPEAHALLRAADMACYDAKRAGRNRVVVGRWQEGLPSLAAATAPHP